MKKLLAKINKSIQYINSEYEWPLTREDEIYIEWMNDVVTMIKHTDAPNQFIFRDDEVGLFLVEWIIEADFLMWYRKLDEFKSWLLQWNYNKFYDELQRDLNCKITELPVLDHNDDVH